MHTHGTALLRARSESRALHLSASKQVRTPVAAPTSFIIFEESPATSLPELSMSAQTSTSSPFAPPMHCPSSMLQKNCRHGNFFFVEIDFDPEQDANLIECDNNQTVRLIVLENPLVGTTSPLLESLLSDYLTLLGIGRTNLTIRVTQSESKVVQTLTIDLLNVLTIILQIVPTIMCLSPNPR